MVLLPPFISTFFRRQVQKRIVIKCYFWLQRKKSKGDWVPKKRVILKEFSGKPVYGAAQRHWKMSWGYGFTCFKIKRTFNLFEKGIKILYLAGIEACLYENSFSDVEAINRILWTFLRVAVCVFHTILWHYPCYLWYDYLENHKRFVHTEKWHRVQFLNGDDWKSALKCMGIVFKIIYICFELLKYIQFLQIQSIDYIMMKLFFWKIHSRYE